MSDQVVPKNAIDYDEILRRRGGYEHGNEDFALVRCCLCGTVYLLNCEIDEIYFDPNDLTRREALPSWPTPFTCVTCKQPMPRDTPWVGPKATSKFVVTWGDLQNSGWKWAIKGTPMTW